MRNGELKAAGIEPRECFCKAAKLLRCFACDLRGRSHHVCFRVFDERHQAVVTSHFIYHVIIALRGDGQNESVIGKVNVEVPAD